MPRPNRKARPIISHSVSDVAAQAVLDGLDAGFTIDEIAPDTGPKIRGEARFNQEGLDEIVDLSSQGGAIPGQSLVNDPEQPYPWERPPEFANPKHALDYMVGLIFQPEAMKNIFGSCEHIDCQGRIAGQRVYHRFVVKAKYSKKYPGKLYGVAGIDPTEGMEGVRKFEWAVKDLGFIFFIAFRIQVISFLDLSNLLVSEC